MFRKQKGGIIKGTYVDEFACRSELDYLRNKVNAIAKKIGIKFIWFNFGLSDDLIDETQKNKIDALTERIAGIEKSLCKIEKIVKADDYKFITETKLVKKNKK